MQTLRQDIAYAFRQMRQSPVFTLTAMLTLALGIGATTAIFSLIHTVMLKSLPVVDPSRLYRIGEGQDCCVEGSPQDKWGMFSYPFYELMKKNTPEFEELAAFQAGGWQVSTRRSESDHIARPLRNEFVSGNYFHTFGLRRLCRTHHPALRRSALRSSGRHAQLSRLAAAIRLRPQSRRLELHPQRPSLHHHRNHSARLLRRNAAQRPSRPLDPHQPGAHVQRSQLLPPPFPGMAARHRQTQARRYTECRTRPHDRPHPSMARQ